MWYFLFDYVIGLAQVEVHGTRHKFLFVILVFSHAIQLNQICDRLLIVKSSREKSACFSEIELTYILQMFQHIYLSRIMFINFWLIFKHDLHKFIHSSAYNFPFCDEVFKHLLGIDK